MTLISDDTKYQRVISKNTFYYFDKEFEEKYEGYINSIKDILLLLRNKIINSGLKKQYIEEIIENRENGLRAILALTGFSNENLKRIITLIRVVEDEELNRITLRDFWIEQPNIISSEIREWGDAKIKKLIIENQYFRRGLVNLFFEGATIPLLSKTLPLFEIKKLSLAKLKFEASELIDTLVRYKEKGSYSGKKEKNPERLIENIIAEMDYTHETGDLSELIINSPNTKRTMDFIIPNKINPKIIIECSYLATTSSGQGDKSKTEISIDALIKQHYPEADFIGFIDGIGWYVRKGDLRRMVSAYKDVYTFHEEEIDRFKKYFSNKLL